jgi:pilus assembly protein CpaC
MGQIPSRFPRLVKFSCALAALFAVAATSMPTLHAQPSRTQPSRAEPSRAEPSVRHVQIIINKSQTVTFTTPFKTASIASTDVADVTPLTDRSLYIQGKRIGTTSISVFDQNMQLVELLDLEVTFDARNLQRRIKESTGSSVSVSTTNQEVILSGSVPDAVTADRIVSVARSMVAGPNLVNALSVAPSQQVMLKVRFLEASRDAERDLGVNWFASNKNGTRGVNTGLGVPVVGSSAGVPLIGSAGALLTGTPGAQPFGVVLANLVNGGTNIDVMISALETKGLVRRLAEPDLVALSGDEARFLAGGEFPVPTAISTTGAGVTPTVEFKKFGVGLAFVPTVMRDGLINLRIAPEVSEIDPTVGVTFNGTTIPGVVTRNARTTIELRDGQSFAIAGLLQNRSARHIEQLPWLGSVPVLGTLFRSSSYLAHETDLVIIVTPHLVRPSTPVDKLATPFDQRLPSNDVDFFINGQMEVPKRYSDYVTSGGNMNGPYGYILPVEQGLNQPIYKNGAAK